MHIYLAHMDKRINSTKHAITTSESLQLDVTLKEPTSEVNPVFIVKRKHGDKNITLYYNYIWQEGWGYYYVDDIVHVTNDIVEIYCHRDVLGTGYDYVHDSAGLLAYCSDETKINKAVIDERLTPDIYLDTYEEPYASFNYEHFDRYLADQPSDGTVMLTVVGQDVGSRTYVIPFNAWPSVIKGIAIASSFTDVNALASTFFGENWKACVQGAVYMPFKPGLFRGEMSVLTDDKVKWGSIEIPLEYTDSTFSTSYVTAAPWRLLIGEGDIDLGWANSGLELSSNDMAQFKSSKYSSVSFSYPGGTIDISNDLLAHGHTLHKVFCINVLDGTVNVRFLIDNNPCGEVSFNLGFDIMSRLSSSTSTNEMVMQWNAHMVKEMPKIIASSATPYGAISSISSGIFGSFLDSSMGNPQIYSSSTSGVETYFRKNGALWESTKSIRVKRSTRLPVMLGTDKTKFEENLATFHARHGWPCNKVYGLHDMPEGAYVQGIGFTVGIVKEPHYSLTANEIAQINEFINTGIYLEDLNT